MAQTKGRPRRPFHSSGRAADQPSTFAPDTTACSEPFTALGINYASGAMTPETQTVFSLE